MTIKGLEGIRVVEFRIALANEFYMADGRIEQRTNTELSMREMHWSPRLILEAAEGYIMLYLPAEGRWIAAKLLPKPLEIGVTYRVANGQERDELLKWAPKHPNFVGFAISQDEFASTSCASSSKPPR